MMRAVRPRNFLPVFAIHLALIALALVNLIPFLWLFCAAFKRPADTFDYAFLPWGDLSRLTLANFTTLFSEHAFGAWVVNSVFVASTYTVSVVTLSSLGGFALAKYHFSGKRTLMILMLATMLLPGQVILGSLYQLMDHLGWIDSYLAILVPGAVSVFGTFLFRQAFLSVPDELVQSARLDGCGELRIWWEIALPLVRPTVGAYTLMSFLASWTGFLWPQIVLRDESKYTLPLGLNNLVSLPGFQSQYGLLAAGTLLGIVPVLVVFLAVQRDFIAGLAGGGVKG
jgi:ABC-type glycerol-3-phosphate transport system permease component